MSAAFSPVPAAVHSAGHPTRAGDPDPGIRLPRSAADEPVRSARTVPQHPGACRHEPAAVAMNGPIR